MAMLRLTERQQMAHALKASLASTVSSSAPVFPTVEGRGDDEKNNFAVGDRVRVRWKDALYDAKVIKLRPNGEVAVVYDVDSTVGDFLSAAEHGLNKLPELSPPPPATLKMVKGSQKNTVCSVAGCPDKARTRGLCSVHCIRLCSVEGCSTNEKARGLCAKHGARGKCLIDNCSANAQHKGSFCGRHGGKDGFCTTPGCETPRRQGSNVCVKHGANGICTVSGCNTSALYGKAVCSKHSTDKLACSAESCSNLANIRGLCATHAGKRTCSTAACGTAVLARGLCRKHGAFGFCSFSGCTTNAISIAQGRCAKHGAVTRAVCKMNGCTTPAKARGVCLKHGAYGTCQVDGCTTNARRGTPHCPTHSGR